MLLTFEKLVKVFILYSFENRLFDLYEDISCLRIA